MVAHAQHERMSEVLPKKECQGYCICFEKTSCSGVLCRGSVQLRPEDSVTRPESTLTSDN
jgi:hypothetical protein